MQTAQDYVGRARIVWICNYCSDFSATYTNHAFLIFSPWWPKRMRVVENQCRTNIPLVHPQLVPCIIFQHSSPVPVQCLASEHRIALEKLIQFGSIWRVINHLITTGALPVRTTHFSDVWRDHYAKQHGLPTNDPFMDGECFVFKYRQTWMVSNLVKNEWLSIVSHHPYFPYRLLTIINHPRFF